MKAELEHLKIIEKQKLEKIRAEVERKRLENLKVQKEHEEADRLKKETLKRRIKIDMLQRQREI